MQDTELVYLMLSRLFNERDKKVLYQKIISLSNKEDSEIIEILKKIKPIKELVKVE